MCDNYCNKTNSHSLFNETQTKCHFNPMVICTDNVLSCDTAAPDCVAIFL